MFETLLALFMVWAPVALTVLGGLIAALAAIAPLTKNTTDDGALRWLHSLQDLLVRLIKPQPTLRK
jgi:hypothetical protein